MSKFICVIVQLAKTNKKNYNLMIPEKVTRKENYSYIL